MKQKVDVFEKMNKIKEVLANLSKRKKEKAPNNKIIVRKVISQQSAMKFRGSLGNT
jgi:hypothetical protein